mmetsp:Transcript_7600/g.17401  ORF Transcript_7600/g.17401 Transcript_7600/m.17401 type:complete len:282 (+) Transcript_7600:1592-2437(+)
MQRESQPWQNLHNCTYTQQGLAMVSSSVAQNSIAYTKTTLSRSTFTISHPQAPQRLDEKLPKCAVQHSRAHKHSKDNSEYVHDDLYRRAAVGRVHPHLLQQQGQDRSEAYRREDDHAKRDGDGHRLGEWGVEQRRAEEAGRRQHGRQRERHPDLPREELALRTFVERPEGQAAYHPDARLVARVAACANEHGKEVHKRGMVLKEGLVPRQDEPAAGLEGEESNEPDGARFHSVEERDARTVYGTPVVPATGRGIIEVALFVRVCRAAVGKLGQPQLVVLVC